MCHAMTRAGHACRLRGPRQSVTLQSIDGVFEEFKTGLCSRHYHELQDSGSIALWRPRDDGPGLYRQWFTNRPNRGRMG
jgi:hypothetical protein